MKFLVRSLLRTKVAIAASRFFRKHPYLVGFATLGESQVVLAWTLHQGLVRGILAALIEITLSFGFAFYADRHYNYAGRGESEDVWQNVLAVLNDNVGGDPHYFVRTRIAYGLITYPCTLLREWKTHASLGQNLAYAIVLLIATLTIALALGWAIDSGKKLFFRPKPSAPLQKAA